MSPDKVVAKGMRERYNRIILMCMIFTTGFTHLKHTGVEFSIYLPIHQLARAYPGEGHPDPGSLPGGHGKGEVTQSWEDKGCVILGPI